MGENFDVSGPLHLLPLQTSFNWRNPFHQRSFAASLVQGVYNLEHDRQRGMPGALASPWCERFDFKLNKALEDDDRTYFGAIYELRNHPQSSSSPCPPRYVIAFRGTLITPQTGYKDVKLNLRSVVDTLEMSYRYRTTIEAVQNTVKEVGAENVWLAGHSLGASIAMLAGRNMAKSQEYLETYLFNPPFLSVRIARSLVKAGIAKVKKNHEVPEGDMYVNRSDRVPEGDLFSVLSEWRPRLYVHRLDPICTEYIGYFEHREEKEKRGAGRLERLAKKSSFGRRVSGTIKRYLEQLHIVPTAYMTENPNPSEDFNFSQAHAIKQWWQQDNPDFPCQSKLYKFKTL